MRGDGTPANGLGEACRSGHGIQLLEMWIGIAHVECKAKQSTPKLLLAFSLKYLCIVVCVLLGIFVVSVRLAKGFVKVYPAA